MSTVKNLLSRFIFARTGIASVEYALLLALIGGGILAGALGLNAAVSGKMVDSATCIESDDPLTDCN